MGKLDQNTDVVQKDLDNIEQMALTGLSGFDRTNADKKIKGILQFCYDASSQEVHQIDEDGAYTKLTSQTTFADGTTAIADRTIAIYRVSGETSFKYFYQGTEVEETGIKTVQIADNGGGYVYFDPNGDLVCNGGSTFTYIVKESLITYVGWNTTKDELLYFADERHGIDMKPTEHLYAHDTKGFAWLKEGSDITGLANNATTFTAVTEGRWADEDIGLVLAEASTAPFMWREGADGQWRISAATNALGLITNSKVNWNNENSGGAGVWGLDEADASHDYIIYTFWASNNVLAPIVRTVGQDYQVSRGPARDRLPYQVYKTQLDGLPSPEMNPIGSIILKTDGTLETGAEGEVWIDHRFGAPVGRF